MSTRNMLAGNITDEDHGQDIEETGEERTRCRGDGGRAISKPWRTSIIKSIHHRSVLVVSHKDKTQDSSTKQNNFESNTNEGDAYHNKTKMIKNR